VSVSRADRVGAFVHDEAVAKDGVGRVFRAHHVDSDTPVALKG
jgi:hypothetical protein